MVGGQWRRGLLTALAVGAMLLPMGPAAAQVSKGPAPAWVEAVALPQNQAAPAGGVRDGVDYLLVDRQWRLDGKRLQRFQRYASRALNEQGLQQIANLEWRVDPAYEQLLIHDITVHRNGRAMPRLAAAKLKLLQRETDLDKLLFDGSKTVHVFLEDVRVGDVVEYAYTLSGGNPVFDGRQTARLDFQWGAPVAQVHTRLLWPQERQLQLRAQQGLSLPEPRQLGSHREYRWQLDGQPALRLETGAPHWYDPFAAIEFSEYRDWGDVVDWALPLYRSPERLPAELEAELRRLRALPDAHQRVAEALRFAQREIRYLGIETGANSHAPHPPAQVMARRFGDCKDKTLLLLSLLRRLEIPAWPALVHTRVAQGISNALPSPLAFNHVLVLVRLGDQDYWLDPTRSAQPGPLDKVGQESYGQALVLREGQKALTPMRHNASMLDHRRVKLLLDASGGFDTPAQMEVLTELQGLSAERFRASLAASNLEAIGQQYQNFYARSYSSIRSVASLEVQDLAGENRITVRERYELPSFWTRSEELQRHEVWLQVPEMGSQLLNPEETVRKSPLQLYHPVRVEHELELRLHEDWPTRAQSYKVSSAAFVHERKENVEGRRVQISDRFESTANELPVAELARHLADLEQARRNLNYQLYWSDAGDASPSGMVIGLVLAALSAWLFVAYRLMRWQPLPLRLQADPPRGFWLGLLGVVLVLAWIRLIAGLGDFRPLISGVGWAAATTPGVAGYHPWLAGLLVFEIVVNAGQFVLLPMLFWLWLKRRDSFPLLFVGVMAGIWLALCTDQLLGNHIQDKHWLEDSSNLWRMLISSLAWCAYLWIGERPKQCFCKPHGTAPQPAPVEAAANSPRTDGLLDTSAPGLER